MVDKKNLLPQKNWSSMEPSTIQFDVKWDSLCGSPHYLCIYPEDNTFNYSISHSEISDTFLLSPWSMKIGATELSDAVNKWFVRECIFPALQNAPFEHRVGCLSLVTLALFPSLTKYLMTKLIHWIKLDDIRKKLLRSENKIHKFMIFYQFLNGGFVCL